MKSTGQVLSPTNGGIAPRVVASISDAPVFSHPNQPVGAVVELPLPRQALPVSVAISGVSHHFGLGLTGVLLVDLHAN